MSLTVSENGLALIKKWEGCKLTAYQDSVGIWTIGYGHTSGVTEDMTITQAQADAYLKSDCATAEKAVNKYDDVYNWNQNQFDALVSFAYNIGNIKQLTADGTRSISTISSKILEYNKAGGKVLTGLTNRRKEEKALFDTEVTSSSSSSSTSTSTTSSTASSSTTTEVRATEGAKSGPDSSIAGTYKVTATSGLNVRNGAGTSKKKLVAIPKGTQVKNYGYYTEVSGVKWLYIQFTYNGVKYTGFSSSTYLQKV